uniref:Uncharacterized protein n=1 Tax=Romanomermis culicivorax TaxID=13658 RepID=A0A915JGG0_ROMCU
MIPNIVVIFERCALQSRGLVRSKRKWTEYKVVRKSWWETKGCKVVEALCTTNVQHIVKTVQPDLCTVLGADIQQMPAPKPAILVQPPENSPPQDVQQTLPLVGVSAPQPSQAVILTPPLLPPRAPYEKQQLQNVVIDIPIRREMSPQQQPPAYM